MSFTINNKQVNITKYNNIILLLENMQEILI